MIRLIVLGAMLLFVFTGSISADPAGAEQAESYLRTASGTVYKVRVDGTTIRTGKGEAVMPPSAATVYIRPQAEEGLMADLDDSTRFYLDRQFRTVSQVRVTEGGFRYSEHGSHFPYTTAPAIGLAPLQFFKPEGNGRFAEITLGTPIVAISATMPGADRSTD